MVYIILFSVLVLISFAGLKSSSTLLNQFTIFFLSLFSVLLIGTFLDEEIVFYYFHGIAFFLLSLHFVLARFEVFKKTIYAVSFVSVSMLLFLLLQFDTIQYNGTEITWLSAFLIISLVFASFLHPISEYVSCHLKSLLSLENSRKISTALELGIFAILIFTATLFLPKAGVLLVFIAYTSQLFYRKNFNLGIYFSVLFLLIVGYFIETYTIKSINIIYGKSLLGLFMGMSFSILASIYNALSRRKILYVGTVFSLFIFVIAVFIYLGTQKSDLGGAEFYLAFLLSFGLSSSFFNSKLSFTLAASAILLGLIEMPILQEQKQAGTKKTILSSNDPETDTPTDIMDTPSLPMDSLSGLKKIVADSSFITFKLGPDGGVTEGMFKSMSGTVDFSENTKPKFNIKLALSDMTTFVDMRDQSLMSSSYFNAEKYPNMTFKSTETVRKQDEWEVNGEFTMIGKTNKEKIRLKYIGKSKDGERDVLIGKSSIDRTKYGMKSDPMEGNIVDFEFKIELK